MIGNLPLYSPDFDNDYPPEARALTASIAADWAPGVGQVGTAAVNSVVEGNRCG